MVVTLILVLFTNLSLSLSLTYPTLTQPSLSSPHPPSLPSSLTTVPTPSPQPCIPQRCWVTSRHWGSLGVMQATQEMTGRVGGRGGWGWGGYIKNFRWWGRISERGRGWKRCWLRTRRINISSYDNYETGIVTEENPDILSILVCSYMEKYSGMWYVLSVPSHMII